MFWWRRLLKFYGFTVEEAKPRTRKDQLMVTVDPAEYERRMKLLRTPERIDKSIEDTFPKQ